MAKKPDQRHQHAVYIAQMRQNAESVSAQFPNVSEITVDLTFDSTESHPQPTPGISKSVRTWTPADKAFFWIDCRMNECVGGGFDLSTEVKQLVDSGHTETEGEKDCNGWQDEERVGKNRCFLNLKFKVTVSYKSVID